MKLSVILPWCCLITAVWSATVFPASGGDQIPVTAVPTRACQYVNSASLTGNTMQLFSSQSSREDALSYFTGTRILNQPNNTQTLVIDGDLYYGHYPETLASMLKQHNPAFGALLIRVNGDNSRVGAFALRFWYSFQCDLPVYVVSKSYDAVITTNNTIFLVDMANPEIAFVRGTVCIVLIFIPCLCAVVMLFGSSAAKLYRLGAPCRFNSGISVCYHGVVQAIILAFICIDMMRAHPVFNWPALQGLVTVFVLSSVNQTFIMALAYHRGLNAVAGRSKTWNDPRIIGCTAVTTFLIIAFIISQVGIVTLEQTAYRWSLISSSFYFLFHLFVTVYFAWGQYNTIQVFKAVSISSAASGLPRNTSTTTTPATATGALPSVMKENEERINWMGRRLAWISLASGLNLLCSILISTRAYSKNHGWVLVVYVGALTACISFAEVRAIPAHLSRQENLNKTSAASSSSDVRLMQQRQLGHEKQMGKQFAKSAKAISDENREV